MKWFTKLSSGRRKCRRGGPTPKWILLTTVLVSGVIGGLGAVNAKGLLKKAAEARASKDYLAAIRLTQRYLVHQPDDVSQVVQHALDWKSFAESGAATQEEHRKAFYYMEDAVRRDPENIPLRVAAARLAELYRLGKDAMAHWEKVLESSQDLSELDLSRAEIEVHLARAQMRFDPHSAASRLEKLIGYDRDEDTFHPVTAVAPAQVEAYTLLAVHYRENIVDNDAAERVMEQLISVNKDSYEAFLARARYYLKAGSSEENLKRARSDTDRAVELAPDELDVILLAANIATIQKDWDSAQQYLDQALEKNPDSDDVYDALAELKWRQHDLTAAMEFVEQGLEKNHASVALLWRRAELQLAQGRIAELTASLQSLSRVQFPKDWIDYLRARVLLTKKKWLDASRELERLRPTLLANNPAVATQIDFSLATCFEQLRQPDRALDAYTSVLNVDKGHLNAAWGRARCLAQLGQVDKAILLYEKLIQAIEEVGKTTPPRVLSKLLELKTNRELRRTADERNWEECEKLAKLIRRHENVTLERKVVEIVKLRRAQGRTEQAKKIVDKALEKIPEESSIWLLRLSLVRDDESQYASVLDQMEEQFGDTARIRVMRIGAVLRRGGGNVKVSLAPFEQGMDGYTTQQKMMVWERLARAYDFLRDFDKSKRLWRQGSQHMKESFQPKAILLDLAQRTGDDKLFSEVMDEVAQVHGRDSAGWQLFEATRIVWHVRSGRAQSGELSKARQLLEEARKKRPGWNLIEKLDGDIYRMQSNFDAALKAYELALSLGGNDPRVIRQMVEILIHMNNHERARQLLDRLEPSLLTTDDQELMIELDKNR